MPYIILIFHDQENKQLNAIWMFETMTQIIQKTKGFLKYSDIKTKPRRYKTSKSFFKIMKINRKDKHKYFLR